MSTPTTYERTFAQFTGLTEPVPNVDALLDELAKSAVVPGIDYSAQAVTVSETLQKVFFSFKDVAVEADLDAVVTTHTGVPLQYTELVQLDEPRNPLGEMSFAPGHKLVVETYKNVGHKWGVTAGAMNCYDVQAVSGMIYVAGGTFALKATNPNADIHADDYAEFSVIDKDDVLGLFATYGLTVGVDVLELKKYVVTHYFLEDDNGVRHTINPGTLATVLPGLYLRACYNSHGNTDMSFYVWYDWFET